MGRKATPFPAQPPSANIGLTTFIPRDQRAWSLAKTRSVPNFVLVLCHLLQLLGVRLWAWINIDDSPFAAYFRPFAINAEQSPQKAIPQVGFHGAADGFAQWKGRGPQNCYPGHWPAVSVRLEHCDLRALECRRARHHQFLCASLPGKISEPRRGPFSLLGVNLTTSSGPGDDGLM